VSVAVIYYVRHGLTDWNLQHRLQGRHDTRLNEQGHSQAKACGEILRRLFVRRRVEAAHLAWVSSPLARARETMEVMRASLGLDPADYAVDARLEELAFGDWEGLTYADVLEQDAEVIIERERNKWGFLPPGGESYAQLTRRIAEWHGTLHADTVVAAHGGTGRALMAHLALVPPHDAPHCPVDQGVVYLFADGRVTRLE
jgi:broad specificity phosphatase PhoE